jgi:hypothetical protein
MEKLRSRTVPCSIVMLYIIEYVAGTHTDNTTSSHEIVDSAGSQFLSFYAALTFLPYDVGAIKAFRLDIGSD